MKVFIVVTHLLGTGHLARAVTLARAFGAGGHDAVVVSGGMPAAQIDLAGIDLIQLAPVRSDGVNFVQLLDGDSRPVTVEYMDARRRKLIETLAAQRPDMVITELFPFGRRILRPEFRALLEAADQMRPRPVICSSIRDILAPPSKPAKADATSELVDRYYDAVMVHSDPAITPLDASWPVCPEIAARLRYTGFVAPPPVQPDPDIDGHDEILVSAGGGDVGENLFATALDAAALDAAQLWRLLVGGRDAEGLCAAMRQNAPPNVVIEPARPDFRQMLYHAAASVSMCGYNTALDLLQAGTPSVFVPFDAGGEVEQSLRARTLARLPGIVVLPNADLSGPTLSRAVNAVMKAPHRKPAQGGFDGSARTVEIACELLEKRR